MPKTSARVLLVATDPVAQAAMARSFENDDAYLVTVPRIAEALDLIAAENFDAVVLDDFDPEPVGGGADPISEFRKRSPRLPVVVVANGTGSDIAIRAIKAGAYDFLAKPVDTSELRKAVSGAVAAARRMSTTVEFGGKANAEGPSPDEDALIGSGRAMLEVYKSLGRLSATPVTVLIRGETGTGKELVARALYQHGHRAHRPFVTVNCAAIPENLLETELFGHEKGAFTGAVSARVGKFEQAHGATLFLDEIGDLDLSLQAKLLRVLQEKRIQRVGGGRDIPVDVRIIAATHRNLERMIQAGEFREDLYYRLNVASIALPPLRERPDDIPDLVDFFLRRYARDSGLGRAAISTRAVRYLEEQPWPGNVRQLQNVIRKALLLSRGYAIDTPDLQEILREGADAGFESGESGRFGRFDEFARECLRRARAGEIEAAHPEMIAAAERALFAEALRQSGGNQARAARWLGISRLTLRQKLRALGLRVSRSRGESTGA
ncbi:MAG: sigma-54-dependent Fis family transcriptional regulator [Verrucomicrobiae bacterium]|nr:sigma-54-dependent Fis family transcriptional regulator [Verrucomicrobiae bacterium]